MTWRTVVISKRAKLDLRLNYMVVRGDTTRKIHIGEISTVIVESTEVSLTAALLAELIKQKIKIIFCDEKSNPISELMPYYGCHDCSSKLKQQMAWSESLKQIIWSDIVARKIRGQREVLLKKEKYEAAALLQQYAASVQCGDISNREGHAAKVYFNALFGLNFTRSADNLINAALNYGYAIVLSACNREIVANGYLTQIGIFHDNTFNNFNFGSDLMETLRPFVDSLVYFLVANQELVKFEQEEKMKLVNVLNCQVKCDGKKYYLNHGIKLYCKSVFDALNDKDIANIKYCLPDDQGAEYEV